MDRSKLDEIKIPVEIGEIIQQNIQRALVDKPKPRRNYRKMAMVMVASLVGFTILGISNPAIASKIPIIKNVFKEIQSSLRYDSNYSDYATSVGETVYSNGISVTLSEVICDGENLYVTYVIEKDTPFPHRHGDNVQNLTIYDTDITLTADNQNTRLYQSSTIQGSFIDENTFVGMVKYELNELDVVIPNKFIFSTNIIEITNSTLTTGNEPADEFYIKRGLSGVGIHHIDDNITTGSWKFEIPVTIEKDLVRSLTFKNEASDLLSDIKMVCTPFQFYIDLNYQNTFHGYHVTFYDQDGNLISSLDGRSLDDQTYRHYFQTLDSSITDIEIVINEYENIPIQVIKEDGSVVDGFRTEVLDVVFDKTYPIN